MQFLLLLACVSSKPDTSTSDGCEAVTASCPEDGRAYWSTCESGGWLSVQQCRDDGSCFVAESGAVEMEGWIDLWAECSEGYTTIEGVICCPLES